MPWDIIVDGWRDACMNMALDDTLLDEVAQGDRPPTARVYGWSRASVSVGRFQDVKRTLDLAGCQRGGVSVVRRPTGGRGVLHGTDITICVAVPTYAMGRAGASVTASHRVITSGIAMGLLQLGLRTGGSPVQPQGASSGDCFAAVTAADLADDGGQKLMGGAQCRRRGALLEQVSVLHTPHLLDPSTVFVGSAPAYRFPLAHLDRDAVRDALLDGLLASVGGPARRYVDIDQSLSLRAMRRTHVYAVDTCSGM